MSLLGAVSMTEHGVTQGRHTCGQNPLSRSNTGIIGSWKRPHALTTEGKGYRDELCFLHGNQAGTTQTGVRRTGGTSWKLLTFCFRRGSSRNIHVHPISEQSLYMALLRFGPVCWKMLNKKLKPPSSNYVHGHGSAISNLLEFSR